VIGEGDIIELGTICLKYTNTIEKKKDSSTKLINEGKKTPEAFASNAI